MGVSVCVGGKGVSVCVWLWVWGKSLCMYMCVYMSGCIVRVGMNSLTAFIGGNYSQTYMCVCKCVCVCVCVCMGRCVVMITKHSKGRCIPCGSESPHRSGAACTHRSMA